MHIVQKRNAKLFGLAWQILRWNRIPPVAIGKGGWLSLQTMVDSAG